MDKKSLRKSLLAQRAALPSETAKAYSQSIQRLVLAESVWAQARQIVLYMPIRNEVDTTLLMQRAWSEGKCVLLPRINPECKGEMCLAACVGEHQLLKGTFGLREPDAVCCPPLQPDDPDFKPDLAVIPGVGFDRSGNRLGFGAGYYDRYLAHPSMQQTSLVGVAYSFQILEALPADPWDRRVHALCSEKELRWL